MKILFLFYFSITNGQNKHNFNFQFVYICYFFSSRSNVSPREKMDGNLVVGNNQQMLHTANDINESSVVPYQNVTQNSIDMSNYYTDPLGNSSTMGMQGGGVESPNVIGDYNQVYIARMILFLKLIRKFFVTVRCINNNANSKVETCK